MPQLEQTEFFISQLFWLVLTFSFLLFFLWKISLPRISAVLEKRENKINNDIQTAKHQQAEAEEIQNQIENQLSDARIQGAVLIKESLTKIQKKTSEELSKLDNELNNKIDDSSSIIESNKKESLNQIHEQVHDISKLIISKISSINTSDEEIDFSITKTQNKKIN